MQVGRACLYKDLSVTTLSMREGASHGLGTARGRRQGALPWGGGSSHLMAA